MNQFHVKVTEEEAHMRLLLLCHQNPEKRNGTPRKNRFPSRNPMKIYAASLCCGTNIWNDTV